MKSVLDTDFVEENSKVHGISTLECLHSDTSAPSGNLTIHCIYSSHNGNETSRSTDLKINFRI